MRLHLGVPHPPGVWDGARQRLVNDLARNSFDNLELMDNVLAQILAVVVCSRLLGVVARLQGQPMVMAEITADGKITMTNDRNGYSRTYQAK